MEEQKREQNLAKNELSENVAVVVVDGVTDDFANNKNFSLSQQQEENGKAPHITMSERLSLPVSPIKKRNSVSNSITAYDSQNVGNSSSMMMMQRFSPIKINKNGENVRILNLDDGREQKEEEQHHEARDREVYDDDEDAQDRETMTEMLNDVSRVLSSRPATNHPSSSSHHQKNVKLALGHGSNNQVQHSNNLTSIYNHNSTILKKTGERIKAGEAISVVGNTGEKSKGPHLHFELWFDGQPINPQDFVAF